MKNWNPANTVGDFPAVTVRIEVNFNRSQVLWNVRCDDGTQSKGFAKSRVEGMQKATEFIESTAKAAAKSSGPELVVNNPSDSCNTEGNSP